MMGVVVGYLFAGTRAPGDPPALGVGLSTAMLTFCLFTPRRSPRSVPGDRGKVCPVLTLGAIGLAAGNLGAPLWALTG